VCDRVAHSDRVARIKFGTPSHTHTHTHTHTHRVRRSETGIYIYMSHVEFVSHVCVGFVTHLTMELLRRELPRECAPIICSSYEFVTRSEFVAHSNQCAPIIRSPRASLPDVFNCRVRDSLSHTHSGCIAKSSQVIVLKFEA